MHFHKFPANDFAVNLIELHDMFLLLLPCLCSNVVTSPHLTHDVVPLPNKLTKINQTKAVLHWCWFVSLRDGKEVDSNK